METHEKVIQQETKSGDQQPEIRRAPDFITVYATSARVAYSEYDVRVFLGDVVFPNPADKSVKGLVEERVCIILPPECAERLESALSDITDCFEDVFGRRETS